MLDHWKLAKDLCVCVCVCVCVWERERESIMTHQREVGEWVPGFNVCTHLLDQSHHISIISQQHFPYLFPFISQAPHHHPVPMTCLACPAIISQAREEAFNGRCNPHYLMPNYPDIKGSSLLQWGGSCEVCVPNNEWSVWCEWVQLASYPSLTSHFPNYKSWLSLHIHTLASQRMESCSVAVLWQ